MLRVFVGRGWVVMEVTFVCAACVCGVRVGFSLYFVIKVFVCVCLSREAMLAAAQNFDTSPSLSLVGMSGVMTALMV